MTKIEITKHDHYWAIDAVRFELDGDIYVRTEYKPVARMRLGEVYRKGEYFVAYDLAGNASRAKTIEQAVAKRLAGITSFAA